MTSFDPTPRPALRAPVAGELRPAPDRHHHPALPREVPKEAVAQDEKKVSMKVKVPKSVRRQVKDLADRQGISVGDVIARMVARELRD